MVRTEASHTRPNVGRAIGENSRRHSRALAARSRQDAFERDHLAADPKLRLQKGRKLPNNSLRALRPDQARLRARCLGAVDWRSVRSTSKKCACPNTQRAGQHADHRGRPSVLARSPARGAHQCAHLGALQHHAIDERLAGYVRRDGLRRNVRPKMELRRFHRAINLGRAFVFSLPRF